MNKKPHTNLKLFLTLSAILICSRLILYSTQVDLFYLNLLEKGEKSFKEGRFQDAADELKIAIFGLQRDKLLKGKACVYLGISCYYLKNSKETEKYLRQAFQILGKDGIESLGLDNTDKDILIKLFSSYKIGGYQSPKLSSLEINNLDSSIKNNPRNIDAYYTLFNHYQQENDFKNAKKILENLVKKNPSEIQGYHELGLLAYKEKKYKDAIKHLTRFFELAAASQIDEDVRVTARALLILSAHYKHDKKRTIQLASGSKELLTPGKIENLPLTDRDRTTLLQIMNGIK